MIIRATKKLLNVSGIEGIHNNDPLIDSLPGEWYATLVSMKIPGKMAVHYLHYPSLITILIPGKSLTKSLALLPEKVAAHLTRNGFPELIPEFGLHTTPTIYSASHKGMLDYLNDRKFTVEYRFANMFTIERNEDLELENLFGGKLAGGKYIRPCDVLRRFTP